MTNEVCVHPYLGTYAQITPPSRRITTSARGRTSHDPQIIFDSYGKLTGAQIKTFLLEKVRVVKHSAMERNYHIFYMLGAGASPEQRENWAMGELMTHQFTSQSGCYDRRDGVLDSDLYMELMEAFRVMGFEEDEKAS